MLNEQTIAVLNSMKLFGMAQSLPQRLAEPKQAELSHSEFAALLAQDEKMHRDNRILPIVGDLGGSGALLRIAEEIRRRGMEVQCFYVSNVEFYLYGGDRWQAYVRNLHSLPWSPAGVLIRSYANMWQPHPAQIQGYYMTSLLQNVQTFLDNERGGRNGTYWDMVTHDYVAR